MRTHVKAHYLLQAGHNITRHIHTYIHTYNAIQYTIQRPRQRQGIGYRAIVPIVIQTLIATTRLQVI